MARRDREAGGGGGRHGSHFCSKEMWGFGGVDPADLFAPRWRCGGFIWPWFVYRVINLSVLCAAVVTEWFEPPWADSDKKAIWLAYLSNWTLLGCIESEIYKTIYVAMQKIRGREFTGHLHWIGRTWWCLSTMMTTSALTITVIYWAVLYPGSNDPITYSNITKHVLTSVVVILDLLFAKTPFRLHHFYIPVLYGLIYGLFTFVYYKAGGVNRTGQHFLYKTLRWDEPPKALAFCGQALAATLVLHTIAYVIYRCGGLLGKVGQGEHKNKETVTGPGPGGPTAP